MNIRALTTATLFATLLTLGAWAQVPPPGTVVRPRQASAAPVVIPEHFLRRWDPITVFFPGPVGKAAGTAEHEPARFVRLSPEHPVAAQWIDRSTLQIKPVDPWRSLERYTVRVGDLRVTLSTLMPPPTESIPEDGAENLAPVDRIVLAFPAPIDPKLLARMVSIELRPMPGEGGGPAQWINASGFRVKPLEGDGRSSRYALLLNPPIPGATVATVHLRLSLDDDPDQSFARIRLTTMAPFRIAKVGTLRVQLPMAPSGSCYSREQALDAGTDRTLVVGFTAPPAAIGQLQARRLVRMTPPVEGFESLLVGRELRIRGRFVPGALYHVRLEPVPLTDTAGRTLEMDQAGEFFVRFRESPPFLHWARSSGIVERFGPHMAPVSGRGHDRLDLRLVPLDPVDRGFWPFPQTPVRVDESQRPPGPGEVPGPYIAAEPVTKSALEQRLGALGSPPVSTMVKLPIKRDGRQAKFGLDLAPYLQRIRPAHAPGHYLAGLRSLDEETIREWMRVQVTDLSLTTVEDAQRIAFFVTSLRDARPVAGARIDIDGPCRDGWTEIGTEVTDAQGRAVLEKDWGQYCSVQRVTVTSGDDVLVLGPSESKEGFHDGSWGTRAFWLTDFVSPDEWERRSAPIAYLRTERPIYRPGEPVHILGYVRQRIEGRLKQAPLTLSHLAVVVSGPGETEWRDPVSLDEVAGFAMDFAEPDLPTGRYTVHLEGQYDGRNWQSSEITFRIEAYRIPRFEVILHAPDSVPLDAPFDVGLTARYYAGGGAAGRPVAWRVTQFPLQWSPPAMEGFIFSSDARYSAYSTFESTGLLERQEVTDEEGGAHLTIDPTIEPTAAPRAYVVEATITGADNQTVTSVRRVRALPPFVVGASVPRFLEPGRSLEPKVVVLDHQGKPYPGQKVDVELVEKQWHSYLRAQDFSTGSVRYVTDVVEKTVSTTTVTSGSEPVTVPLAIPRAGVYVVRLTAHDRLGRAQTVAVDLYAAGEEAVGWEKPPKKTLRVSSDRDRYRPGDTAVLVVQSPFQEGRVLAVVERPEGFTSTWLDVKGGTATLELPVEGQWAPAIPVHLILIRGRKPGTTPVPGTAVDMGKPQTLAATKWIVVEPTENQAVLTVDEPHTALPGHTVTIKLRLADADGNPLSGQVALWLVDRAVLALGKELPLDPLKTFIRQAPSEIYIHDSRNLVFGWIPFRESEGGGEGAEAKEGLLKRVTVRRNFKPVAFYDPAIEIGREGKAEIQVKLPDNLTDWAIRAIAADFSLTRLGSATGVLSVRLPVMVQPALPRFVRTGDRFSAAAVARVVEGPGGPGGVELAANGLAIEGKPSRDLDLVPNRPLRVETSVTVPQPDPGLLHPQASFSAAVERRSDGARDAFKVKIPVLSDREPKVRAAVKTIPAGGAVELEAVPDGARPGSLERRLVISTYPGIVKMAAALDVLRRYPYGCTEQRIARARAYLAARRFRRLLNLTDGNQGLKQAMEQTMVWLRQALDQHGFVAYWPGSGGDVTLTAWCVMFLEEAADADFPVDRALEERMLGALERALRSDAAVYMARYRSRFVYRAWALAALARAGKPDRAYAAELVRRAHYLDLESAALVLRILAQYRDLVADDFRKQLVQRLEGGVLVTLHNGEEVYRGIDQDFSVLSPLILPSETRTLAEMTRALHRAAPESVKLPLMVAALTRLGSGDGWGSTNADAAATLALTELLQGGGPGRKATVKVKSGGRTSLVSLGPDDPVAVVRLKTAGPVHLVAGSGAPQLAVMERCRWVPAAPGSHAEQEAHGFVVSREALLISKEKGGPPRKVPLSEPGVVLELPVGQVVEEHVQVVNPEKRHYVAISVPLAAGMEILNPKLATAPPEARPNGQTTLEPTYAEFLDDRAVFFYTTLPAGTYHVYLRTRATTPGRFTQPAARAETMYDAAVYGSGFGAEVLAREHDQDSPR